MVKDVSRLLSLGAVILCALAFTAPAQAGGNCKFPPSKPVVLKDMGPCKFDPPTLSFDGDARTQAACLAQQVATFGKIDAPRTDMPAAIADFVGTSKDLPDRTGLRRLLQERGADSVFGATLDQPVSHAQDGDPLARSATYFVIHDTSSPNYMGRGWPADINTDTNINNLNRYSCDNKIERAHVFINRMGAIMLSHDFEMPWRATKFEMAVEFGSRVKGLFLHTELIQPRRRFPGRGWANDFLAPNPGFSQSQYDSLALTYMVASTRAGFWMIPAFHAVIDEGIWDKHDDPQNFDIAAFAESIDKLRREVRRLMAGQAADTTVR